MPESIAATRFIIASVAATSADGWGGVPAYDELSLIHISEPTRPY